ncbi:MAG: hypothetical protein KF832_23815 [Caldilineaceae bacterium]|nr:hypothetical protein [Caldilineaceae bacterium]
MDSERMRPAPPLASAPPAPSVGEYLQNYGRRLRSGDWGALPTIGGLLLIALIFQSQNANFLTARNFVNLIVQMAGIATMAYGVVFVLLLGEIDLSIGYVSAVAAVTMTLLLQAPTDWPWFAAILVALLIGAGIGLLHGLIVTAFQIPSFVVTLAGLLVWNGLVLIIIGSGGTITIQNGVVIGIASYFLPPLGGWLLALLATGGLVLYQQQRRWARQRRGLRNVPRSIATIQLLSWTLLVLGTVYVVNQDRGIPMAGVILLILLVGLSFLATRTALGRYIYAISGNKEAARRAGIQVEQVRVMVFVLSSVMASLGGIILASRLRSVDTATGGGNLLFNAIAAAVIGGTSLFGGRGQVSSALLGALVIASVENGMGLLGLSSGVKFIITGLVLLLAVLVDTLSRRTRTPAIKV